ncbi:hypothetical protein [Thermococcus sp.]|nr:hypothetical protein [Thermococcus sp.]
MKRRTPVPAVDAVVAAVAINRSLKLMTKDRHFGVDKGRVWGLNLLEQ